MKRVRHPLLAVAVAAAIFLPGMTLCRAQSIGPAATCVTPTALTALGAPLDRTAALLAEDETPKILAMGSSSTVGVGASSAAMNYPSVLERKLRAAFPSLAIKVINGGRSGQDVDEELGRLNRAIIDQRPDLVIWQVGTNALLRREDPAKEEQLIARGVEMMKLHGIDVVLMDMQYAPRVLARQAWRDVERLIAASAQSERVGYFRRFDIMRAWDQNQQIGPAALIGPDGLHMTDTSYSCLGGRLAQSLVEQWQTQSRLVRSTNCSPAKLAGGQPPAGAIAH